MPDIPQHSVLGSLLKPKERKPLAMTKVVKKADGTAIRGKENTIFKAKPAALPISGTVRSPATARPNGKLRPPTLSISRHSSGEPSNPVTNAKSQRVKRPSPAISTPQFTDSDEDEDESETRRKRTKIEVTSTVDLHRKIREDTSFSDHEPEKMRLTHATDIANSELQEHGKYKYGAFFTTLAGDEEESPVVELRYPASRRKERYQLLRPHDRTDFQPLAEIKDIMRVTAEFYVDDATAEKITCEEDGSGMVERLEKYARDGDKGRPGSQTKFISVIEEYNKLIASKRKDGTVAKCIDALPGIPFRLVQHIVKDQVYSRTVSPQITLVRDYEGFSDNVYGELLPRFLSQIFKITGLKSNHVFVDLGSGVGNCVVQAALETGCEAFGCEVQPNCAKLAELQAEEFVPRCRMWGLKPGNITLVEGDFRDNQAVGKALKRADVVLINNQAFTAQTNNEIKHLFLDLKEGCQIVSLKPFRDPHHKIKDTNVNDPVNVLRVQERERFSQMVSWTDDPGKWYLQVKDTSELKAFTQGMKNGRR